MPVERFGETPRRFRPEVQAARYATIGP
jgi:hypothetical protein